MTVFTTFVGAAWGVGIAMWSNGMRKLPLLRRTLFFSRHDLVTGPWEHLAVAGVMGWMGSQYPSWIESTRERIDRKRAESGLPPLEFHPWGVDFAKMQIQKNNSSNN